MPNTKQLTACQMLQKSLIEQIELHKSLLTAEQFKVFEYAIKSVNDVIDIVTLPTERQQLIGFGAKCIENHENGDLFIIENVIKKTYIETFKPNK